MGVNTIQPIRYGGCLYIDELDANNNPTGFIGSLESTELIIGTPVTDKKIISRQCDKFGQTHAAGTTPEGATVEFKLLDQPAKTLAYQLLATTSEESIAAATITDEPVTLTSTLWTELPIKNIDATGFVVTDVAGTTTYAEDVDYVVNRTSGMLRRVEAGTIPDGAIAHVDAASLAYDKVRVDGGMKTQVNVRLRLDLKDQDTGMRGVLYIPKAVIRPNGNIDFMTGEYLESALGGDIVLLPGSVSGFYLESYNF